MKESNPTYYDEIVNDGKCCEYWSDVGDENDWNYGGSPAMNCDWFCHNCPDCDNNPDAFECIMIGEVPLLVIVIFVPFILCIFCAPLSLIYCQRSCREQSSNQTSTPSNQLTTWTPQPESTNYLRKATETPPPPLFQPAMQPQPPMTGVTIQSYHDLPPPPTYQPSYR